VSTKRSIAVTDNSKTSSRSHELYALRRSAVTIVIADLLGRERTENFGALDSLNHEKRQQITREETVIGSALDNNSGQAL
jgi:hypothetical protein